MTAPSPRAAVIVVLYNSRAVVRSCLDGLQATRYPDLQVVVVDNASSDDSLELVRAHPLGPRVIRSEINRGWAGGNNLGIVAALDAGAEYITVLNPDVDLSPDWLRDAVTLMEADRSIGMLDFEGLDGSASVVGEASPPPLRGTDVPAAIGAALVVSASALRRIGPIDERYFLYFEDTDWSLRALRAGFRVVRLNRALGHKPETSSSDRRKLLRAWLSIRNSILMHLKHKRRELPGWLLILVRHALSRGELTYAHLRRLRPYGPARNLVLVGAATLWNVIHLPATLASLRRERRYREEGWNPLPDGSSGLAPAAHR
jgi:GT2 family glycosyltransferase